VGGHAARMGGMRNANSLDLKLDAADGFGSRGVQGRLWLKNVHWIRLSEDRA
jgi:hypothetical protein